MTRTAVCLGVWWLMVVGASAASAQQVIRVRADAPPGGNGLTWTTAFNDLHDGLSAAAAIPEPRNVQVWVTQGVYRADSKVPGSRSESFGLPSGCNLLGGFVGVESSPTQRPTWPAPTSVLHGLPGTGGGPGAFVVLRVDTSDGDSEVDRVTITGANMPFFGVHPVGDGGVVGFGGGVARFSKCIFLQNLGTTGAAYSYDSMLGAAPGEFRDCVFSENSSKQTNAVVSFAPIIAGSSHMLVGCGLDGNTTRGPLIGHFTALVKSDVFSNEAGFDDLGSGGMPVAGVGQGIHVLWTRVTQNTFTVVPVGTPGANQAYAALTAQVFERSLFSHNVMREDGSSGFPVFATAISVQELRDSTVVLNTGTGAPDDPYGRAECGYLSNSVIASNGCSQYPIDCAVVGSVFNQGFVAPAQYSFVTALQFQSTLNAQNCITGEPRLEADGRPMPTSPLIDAGCASTALQDDYDIDGDGDTSELMDIDLYGNPRAVDDPFRPDSGCLPYPYLTPDMGYAEHMPVCPVPGTCDGVPHDWLRPGGGPFASSGSWSLGVPTGASPVRFRLDNETYAISFAQSHSSLSADIVTGTVQFDLNGFRYDLLGSTNGVSLNITGRVPGHESHLRVRGGTVRSGTVRIAETSESIGILDLDGPSSVLSVPLGTISVGVGGSGDLIVSGGATASAQIVNVGELPTGSTSQVVVTGPGSRLIPRFGLNLLGGRLFVENGAMVDMGTTGDMIVLQNAEVFGDGSIRGDAVNFGRIAPGPFLPPPNQPAFSTLTITGNYTQIGSDPKVGATSGRLDLDLGSSAGQSDRLLINGVASLAGGLFISLPPGADPPVNTTWSPVTATGGFPFMLNGRANQFDVAYFPGLAGRIMRVTYPSPLLLGGSLTVSVVPFSSLPSLNASNYTFGGEPTDAVLRDFDNDGDIDLAVTIPNPIPLQNGEVVLLLNAGNAPGGAWNGYVVQQQTITVGRFPSGIDGADIDGDGDNDMVVCNRDDNTVQVVINNGGASFTALAPLPSGGSAPEEVVAARIDAGTTVDLVVANSGSDTLRVFRNAGAGVLVLEPYALPTGAQPFDVLALDLDGDGDSDLATADSGANTVSLFLLGPVQPPGQSPYLPRRVLPVGTRPVEIEPGGLDNPKDLNDLAVVCAGDVASGGSGVSVLRNIRSESNAPFDDPTSVFAPAVTLPVGNTPRSLAILDLDADTPHFDGDIAVVTDGDTPGTTTVRFLRNDTNGGVQLGFALAGQVSGSPDNVVLVRAADVGGTSAQDLVTINSDLLLRGTPPDRGAGKVRVLENALPGIPPPCVGDLTGDHAVNTADLVAFLGAFGTTVPPSTGADFTGDGAVNTADLVVFLGRFGAGCA